MIELLKFKSLKEFFTILLLIIPLFAISKRVKVPKYKGYKLVWSEEFNRDGKVDPAVWSFEHGFVRNEEDQWYSDKNAICKDGVLVIEGRKERVKNPKYNPKSRDWKLNRPYANYTAASIKTRGKKSFLYGRFEVRAKIPVTKGAWPAIWTLGSSYPWPSCGEIDLMEFYQIDNEPHILANVAHGGDQPYKAKWDSAKIPFSHFLEKDSNWSSKFHLWRMDWDSESIKLYLDGELLNQTSLSKTINGRIGNHTNPFNTPQFILLNLAMGGENGGKIDDKSLPIYYEVDYVRVYQKR